MKDALKAGIIMSSISGVNFTSRSLDVGLVWFNGMMFKSFFVKH